jgi:hypothetical protein
VVGTAASVPPKDGRALVARLRAEGLSIRTISERTGIPRSTVADHVLALGDRMPTAILGRDGRRYPAVRDAGVDEPARMSQDPDVRSEGASPVPGPERVLRHLLLVENLRRAHALLADVGPPTGPDRALIARELRAIANLAGIREPTAPSTDAGRSRTRLDRC